MWTKITKLKTGSGQKRKAFGLQKFKAGYALFLVPDGVTEENRADVFSDGNRLAFHLNPNGDYSLYGKNGKGSPRAVRIRSEFVCDIPPGTHDVSVYMDGDMYVLDLRQLTPKALAAE